MRILFHPGFLLLMAAGAMSAPVINEVQSTNTDFPDPSAAGITDPAPFAFLYPDWIEIHNPDPEPVVLDGYYLSDSVSNPTKYRFPAGTTLAPGGFLVVWCATVQDFPDNRTAYHANFGISSSGEAIVLTAPDGVAMVDQFPALPIGTEPAVSGGLVPPGAAGRSLGRGTGANFETFYFYTSPTIGRTNAGPATEAVPLEPPVFSVPGGLYQSAQTVVLSTGVADGVIRYTLDGSDPTESSSVYSGPLTLTSAGNPATSYSSIPTNEGSLAGYPFYDNWRPPAGPVARMNVLRARVFKDGRAPSRTATQSYLVDPSGADRYGMPVVSIVTDPANLFSTTSGIYVPGGKSGYDQNFFQSGSAWERFSHLEFFEDDGTLLFGGEIGLRINGNTTRERPRKALRIYNRSTTGSTTWNARLFPGKSVTAWDTFLLRAGGNDWNQSTFRDALVSEIAGPTGLDRQHARPVVVFLDGEYWGIHNLRDRIDEPWFFHHYGLQESEFTCLEIAAGAPSPLNPGSDFSNPIYDRGHPELLADYKDILARAGRDEFSGAAGYEALAARIDVDNYIDYNAVTIWSGNTDWPGNNVMLWRAVAPDASPGADPRRDGRWRYIVKDNDFALGLNLPYVPGHDYDVSVMAQHNTLAYASSPTETTFANNEIATRLLRKALENGIFRTNFITRFADLLNTTLSAAASGAKLEEFVAAYGPGMTEHQDRWPTELAWTNEVARIRSYLQARPAAVRSHIAGKFGLAGTADLTVDMAGADQGSVTVNTISIDPSTPGVGTNAYPWTGTYFRGLPVTVTALPKPGYRFVSWSTSAPTGGSVDASDTAANYTAWTSGSSGGTGFGPWTLNASTRDRDRAGFFLDNSRGGWGLYANREQTAVAYRSLSNALQVGQTFTTRVRHGLVGSPGDVGFELANNSGRSLFKVACYWWSPTYEINGEPTDIPVTTSPLDIEVTLVSSNSYSVRLAPLGGTSATHSGTLVNDTDQSIRRFIVFNYSAGSGSNSDVFVTSMQTTTPGHAGPGGGTYAPYSTNATITPTLSANTSFIAAFEPEPAVALSITPPVWTVGFGNAPVTVRAVNSRGDTDANFAGAVTLTVTGPGGVVGTYSAAAVEGVATFATADLPAGSYSLSAESGALATDGSAALTVRAAATFLPPGDGVWHDAANWDAAAVPDSAAVSVIIPPNTAGNRSVTNNAPTTVASVTFELGNSAFRNRINGTAGQPFTLASTSGVSTITVNGTGAGHANIEVPGGVVLSNQVVLDVQNTGSTNVEYGALRLQGAIAGPGAIVKRGPGVAGITGAGKAFSGDITVEQGVLTFSEPAITANGVTNYTVQPGGQLRLSSAGHPRNYLFKGPLHLAGSGRSGVPEDENLGVLGALRLETGSTGTLAVLTNNVHLTASAGVHVPAANAIRFDGPLTAAAGAPVLTKSGGGTLVLSPAASAFTGGLAVNRGTLLLQDAHMTNTAGGLVLADETVLTGAGRWGGTLEARPGSTLAFTTASAPESGAPLRTGSFAASGAVTIAVSPGEGAVAGSYPLLAVDGAVTGAENLSLSLATTNFPGSTLRITDGTLYAVLTDSAEPAAAWLAQHGLPTDASGDGADTADPDGDGVVNLVERALFMNPRAAEAGGWPVTTGPDGGTFIVSYRVARGQTDLSVTAESSPVLGPDAEWTALGPDVADDTHPDYTVYRVTVPRSDAAGFVRLKVAR